jgi:peptidoglycan/xylan/chitin deacetylase (PgdA/CDA1 family)
MHAMGTRRRKSQGDRGFARPVLLVIALVALVAAGLVVIAWPRLDGHGEGVAAASSSSPSASPSERPSGPPSASPPAGATAVPRASSAAVPMPHFVTHPQPVPILVYHHVVRHPTGPALVTMSTARFRSQMAWLAARGYEAVTLRRVYDAWTGAGTLPPRAVVLSFDDGYVDQVRNAAPVLREYGWPAQLNLVFEALYLGETPPTNRLTPGMVRTVLGDGWELTSHSYSHPDLTRLDGARLRRQLLVSRRRLRETFHVPVDFFCYPGGIYTRRIKRAARDAGYLAATGTRYGAATPRDLYSLPRVYCYKGETSAVFAARLKETLAAAD